jgi:hypothetical protein
VRFDTSHRQATSRAARPSLRPRHHDRRRDGRQRTPGAASDGHRRRQWAVGRRTARRTGPHPSPAHRRRRAAICRTIRHGPTKRALSAVAQIVAQTPISPPEIIPKIGRSPSLQDDIRQYPRKPFSCCNTIGLKRTSRRRADTSACDHRISTPRWRSKRCIGSWCCSGPLTSSSPRARRSRGDRPAVGPMPAPPVDLTGF